MRRALTASANVNYFFFSGARVEPYLGGGFGRFSEKYVYPHLSGMGQEYIFTEREGTEDGVHVTLGGGVRVAVARAISLRPEFTYYYWETFRMTRASIAAGYQW
jgi:opacity protein-like surface antigen